MRRTPSNNSVDETPAGLSPQQVLFNPELFAAYFLKILDKKKQLVPFRFNNAQAHFMRNRTGRDLILKARQLGFSTAVQGEMFRRAITTTVTAMTMAHDDQTTQKLRRMQDRFWNNCRIAGVQPSRKYSNSTLVTYPDFDSTCVIATAGSKEAGRGDTYSDFHGSEVAFWADAEKIMAGAMQGGNPDIVLESTPNGAQGWFYDRCLEALSGKSEWTLHFYPWWWDTEYRIPLIKGETLEYTEEETVLVATHGLRPDQIKWRRAKQRELRRLFIQEYPEDPQSCFLVSGESYFGNLANVFTAPMDQVKYKPVSDTDQPHKYSAGLDWGRENDYTVLVVIDVTTKKQVDLLHVNKLPWSEIRHRTKMMLDKWGIRVVVAEENSIGSTNIEELEKLGVRVHPFATLNKNKAEIMSDLYEAIHEKDLKLFAHAETRHQFESFISTQLDSGVWRISAAGKGHDDIVIATALAWLARDYVRTQVWI